MRGVDGKRLALAWCAAFLLSLALFVLWPEIDLAVTGLFYQPGEGFALAKVGWIDTVRHAIWAISIVMVLGAAAVVTASLLGRPPRWPEPRRAAFILALYLLGPALLVDGILKRFWGRARPASVEAFGGDRHFTPPWLPTDQCASNCSFVSGEGAAATALAISLAVLAPSVRRAAPAWAFRLYVALAVIAPAIGLSLRVMLGRHFLSDTIFAMLFVGGIALILHRLILARR